MELNTIRLSLGSLVICMVLACTNTPTTGTKALQINTAKIDTCSLKLYIGSRIESDMGCRNCHIKSDSSKLAPNIPIFRELSAMDSLTLKNYIFKSKHNGMYSNELKPSGEKLDKLTDCQIRNMMHYIKNYGRDIPKH